ncbi:hypothetical protein B0H13DRAFT_1911337 [Mycena leptocephala]|nr:hypothetical protein B0H13DRAFT_1911337 [Mycena leptocephala]
MSTQTPPPPVNPHSQCCSENPGEGCGLSFPGKTALGLCQKCSLLNALDPKSEKYKQAEHSQMLVSSTILVITESNRKLIHCARSHALSSTMPYHRIPTDSEETSQKKYSEPEFKMGYHGMDKQTSSILAANCVAYGNTDWTASVDPRDMSPTSLEALYEFSSQYFIGKMPFESAWSRYSKDSRTAATSLSGRWLHFHSTRRRRPTTSCWLTAGYLRSSKFRLIPPQP